MKKLLPTILFYVAAIAGVFLLETIAPSGPCNPGLGFLAFFLLIPVCAILLLRSLYQALIKKNQQQIGIAVIHFIALVLLLTIPRLL